MSLTDRSAPRVPADHGLACLGLLMQLAGNVLAAYGVLAAFVALFAFRGRGGDTLWVFLVLALGAARALAHRHAGTQLVYGDRAIGVPGPVGLALPDERRLSGIHGYLAVALAHATLVTAIARLHFDAGTPAVLALFGGLLVWPAVLLAVTTRPGMRALGRHLPGSADKGFEAVAIVMTILAAAGLALGLGLLGYLFDRPAERLQQGPALLAIVMLCALVVRSGYHLRAGIAGLRETSIERAVGYATRYANFGVISTFCAGAVMLLCVTFSRYALRDLAIVIGLVWTLLAWPLIVRRFFADRQFDDLLAGAAAERHHRAPDAGLSGLGWLLAGNAAIGVSWLLLRTAVAGLPALQAAVGTLGAPDAALGAQLGVLALGGWAAVELVGMTARAPAAAVAWAVAAVGLSVYLVAPELGAARGGLPPTSHLAGTVWLAGQIVLAVATLRLVTRRVTPSARARYRSAGPRS